MAEVFEPLASAMSVNGAIGAELGVLKFENPATGRWDALVLNKEGAGEELPEAGAEGEAEAGGKGELDFGTLDC